MTYKYLLPLCECRWGGESMWKWWGTFDTTCCNQTCLTLLYWEAVGTQKPNFHLPSHTCILMVGTLRLNGQDGTRVQGQKDITDSESFMRTWGCKCKQVKVPLHPPTLVPFHPPTLAPSYPFTFLPLCPPTLLPSCPWTSCSCAILPWNVLAITSLIMVQFSICLDH